MEREEFDREKGIFFQEREMIQQLIKFKEEEILSHKETISTLNLSKASMQQ